MTSRECSLIKNTYLSFIPSTPKIILMTIIVILGFEIRNIDAISINVYLYKVVLIFSSTKMDFLILARLKSIISRELKVETQPRLLQLVWTV